MASYSIGEMPQHSHTMRYRGSTGPLSWGYLYDNGNGINSSATEDSGGVGLRGNSEYHNNMSPWVGVYIWKRCL